MDFQSEFLSREVEFLGPHSWTSECLHSSSNYRLKRCLCSAQPSGFWPCSGVHPYYSTIGLKDWRSSYYRTEGHQSEAQSFEISGALVHPSYSTLGMLMPCYSTIGGGGERARGGWGWGGEPTSAVGIKSVLHPQPKGRISHSNCECSSSNLLGIDARPPLGAKGRASRAPPPTTTSFGVSCVWFGVHLWTFSVVKCP